MFDDPMELEALGCLTNLLAFYPSDGEPSGCVRGMDDDTPVTRAELKAQLGPQIQAYWDRYLADHPPVETREFPPA